MTPTIVLSPTPHTVTGGHMVKRQDYKVELLVVGPQAAGCTPAPPVSEGEKQGAAKFPRPLLCGTGPGDT